MSQNVRLLHVSNLSVRNFLFFCSCSGGLVTVAAVTLSRLSQWPAYVNQPHVVAMKLTCPSRRRVDFLDRYASCPVLLRTFGPEIRYKVMQDFCN